jgi:polysaccharide pyruvyl transferase WcaK-like protein
MIKICHMASYDKNIGDNAAIYNIRNWFDRESDLELEWHSVDMNEFYSRNNSLKYSKNYFSNIDKKYDAILIGGGGLIEGHIYNKRETGWKLPFTKEILELIDIPIFCVGLGVNYFRGCDRLTDAGKKNLSLLIDSSKVFSVRNDGSQQILGSYGIRVNEIPDPGLIFNPMYFKDRKVPRRGFFQPARNSSQLINQHRDLDQENLKFLQDFCIEFNLGSLPHTPKDFSFFQNVPLLIDPSKMTDLLKSARYKESLSSYFIHDFSVAMRGHGQLIACGLNLPGIYLSTQDKVFGFALKNGYLRYTVDTSNKNWKTELKNKVSLLLNDQKYLNLWYDLNESNNRKFHNDFSIEMRKIEALLK